MYFQRQGLFNLPPVVKTLLIINVAMFALSYFIPDFQSALAVYSFKSEYFKTYQLITHMFLHGGFFHLFFNMFALYMFGKVLEEVWGSKRFLIYYFFTGLGAALLHLFVLNYEISTAIASMDTESVNQVFKYGTEYFSNGYIFKNPAQNELYLMINTRTVGASGAVYGLLLAFGVLFPNSLLYIYAAIPVKAKYLVLILTGIELYMGFMNRTGDNIAHFAHLGGMLFGLIFILAWNKWKFKRWN
jgi:membrane associated rhomboid family serine protease